MDHLRNGRNGTKNVIDLHCHILPGMDDGAKDISEAKKMLALSCASGVNATCLTPHFYPEQKTVNDFLAEREKAWEELANTLDPDGKIHIRLGAEVRYCEKLLSLDLRKLTLGDSDYLLLELPESRYPAYLTQIVEVLLDKGLIPIFAHVERYAYFREEPELLGRQIDRGALAQVTAQALFNKLDRNFSMACLHHGLAQIVASDAHNATGRKPEMALLQKLPQELRNMHNAFSTAVWDNELPPYIRATNVKKTAFGYR